MKDVDILKHVVNVDMMCFLLGYPWAKCARKNNNIKIRMYFTSEMGKMHLDN